MARPRILHEIDTNSCLVDENKFRSLMIMRTLELGIDKMVMNCIEDTLQCSGNSTSDTNKIKKCHDSSKHILYVPEGTSFTLKTSENRIDTLSGIYAYVDYVGTGTISIKYVNSTKGTVTKQGDISNDSTVAHKNTVASDTKLLISVVGPMTIKNYALGLIS